MTTILSMFHPSIKSSHNQILKWILITLRGQQVKCNALLYSISLLFQDYRPSFLNIFASWEFFISIIFIPQKKNRDLKWISPAGSLRPSGRLHDSDKCDRSIFFSPSDSRVCKCIMHYIDILHVRTVSHLRSHRLVPGSEHHPRPSLSLGPASLT